MYTILKTDVFEFWAAGLQDQRAKARILARILAAELGDFGDAQTVGDGVLEMRIHYGPGYRVYYARRGRLIYLLLNGGDKSSQPKDIKRAKAMLAALPGEK